MFHSGKCTKGNLVLLRVTSTSKKLTFSFDQSAVNLIVG